MDGNPIFSAKNLSNGETLRVVLDENIEKLNYFTDKSKKNELVIIGNIKSLKQIKKKIEKWTKKQ